MPKNIEKHCKTSKHKQELKKHATKQETTQETCNSTCNHEKQRIQNNTNRQKKNKIMQKRLKRIKTQQNTKTCRRKAHLLYTNIEEFTKPNHPKS